MELFVVTANHQSGGGRMGSLVLASGGLGEAVNAARDTENLGYDLGPALTNVRIERVETGQVYRKEDHPSMHIMTRRHVSSPDEPKPVWVEEWEDPALEEKYPLRR